MGKRNKKSDKKKKKNNGKIYKIFICLLVVLGIFGGIVVKRAYDLDWNWVALLFGHNSRTLENMDRITVLILGVDAGKNTDTMLILTYDPKTQDAGMLSIPRDTFIGDNPQRPRASDKINSIGSKNPEKSIEAVNKITGLDIEYYLMFDNDVLVELVDIIGGIYYDVPIDMKYDDNTQDLHINLKAGYQKLNGEQVKQLSRFRHNNDGSTYPYSWGIEDYGRMRTQRAVVTTIARQTIKLKNVTEIGKIVDALEKNIQTNMNFKDYKDYIPYGMLINLDEIHSEQLPGEDSNQNSIGVWFFYPNQEETKTIVDRVFNRTKPEVIDVENTN